MKDDFINVPVEYEWSQSEIYQEYVKVDDKKSICRQFGITMAELNRIIKEEKVS